MFRAKINQFEKCSNGEASERFVHAIPSRKVKKFVFFIQQLILNPY